MVEYSDDFKRKRNRKALSCTECKSRKIKCDRGEPQCQSCIIRGIQGRCTYGSLPKERIKRNDSGSREEPHKKKKRRSSKHDDHDRDDVDLIIDAVMKRLKGKKRSRKSQSKRVSHRLEGRDSISDGSSSQSESSFGSVEDEDDEDDYDDVRNDDLSMLHHPSKGTNWEAELQHQLSKRKSSDLKTLLYYRVKVAPNTLAKKVPVTAFGGYRPPYPFFPIAVNPDTLIDPKRMINSLKLLPDRFKAEILIKRYLDEIEPAKGVFNTVILQDQLKEFWKDFDRLNDGQILPDNTGSVELATNIVKKNEIGWYSICTLPLQGLIAVIFRLIDIGCRLSDLDQLIQLGILSNSSTQKELDELLNNFVLASQRHFDASKGLVIPTLWTLQHQRLTDFSTNAMIQKPLNLLQFLKGASAPDQFPQSNLSSLQIAISLGLNRLGSGYDDVDNPTIMQSNTIANGPDHYLSASKESGDDSILPKQEDLLTSSMKFGSSIAIFAEGNFAHRELGRKLWTNLVNIDALISSHMNHHHYINDLIDKTSPPLPMNDADLCLPNAKLLALRCRSDDPKPNDNAYCAYSTSFSKILRRMVEMENSKGAPLPYSDILLLDNQFHDLLNGLPKFLSLKTKYKEQFDSIDRMFLLQCGLVNDQANFRLILLHRAYLGRGFKDKRFRRSLLSCISAANAILKGRRLLRKAKCFYERAVFLESHLIHAALVFQLVLLHELERPSYKNHHSNKSDQEACYGLVGIDEAIEFLEECLMFLTPGSQLASLKEYTPALERFLMGAKEKIRIQRQSSSSFKVKGRSDEERREYYDTSDAATILASMPKTPISHTTSSSSPLTPNSAQMLNLHQKRTHQTLPHSSSNSSVIDAAQAGAELIAPSLSVYDPSIWSLDALFPNYGDDGIDLIAALEKELMFGNNNNVRS